MFLDFYKFTKIVQLGKYIIICTRGFAAQVWILSCQSVRRPPLLERLPGPMSSAHPLFKGQCAPAIASVRSVEHIYGAHFCASATINGKWPALRLSAECRKATWYPSFGGRAVMPAKVGAEGRDFVE